MNLHKAKGLEGAITILMNRKEDKQYVSSYKTSEKNAEGKYAKEIRRSEEGYAQTALKLIIKRLFPPYKDMQLIPWYSWVDGKPWLMPAAWIYRWGYCLIHKRKDSAELLTEPYRKKKEIEKREEYLEHWGL